VVGQLGSPVLGDDAPHLMQEPDPRVVPSPQDLQAEGVGLLAKQPEDVGQDLLARVLVGGPGWSRHRLQGGQEGEAQARALDQSGQPAPPEALGFGPQ